MQHANHEINADEQSKKETTYGNKPDHRGRYPQAEGPG